MKHRLLYFLLLLPLHLHAEGLTLDEARRLAERYYAVLERAASQPKESRVVFDNELVSIFGTDFNGKSVEDQFWVANDADAVYGANGGKLSSISVQDYITKIRSYAKAGKIRLEHELLDCFYLERTEGPIVQSMGEVKSTNWYSQDKKGAGPYIEVLVRRTLYRDGSKVEEFVERMDIKVSTAFPFIRNKYGSMPKSAEGSIATAYSLYGQKEYDEAFRLIKHAHGIDPLNKDAIYWISSYVVCGLLGQSDLDEAYKMVERTLELDPKNYQACFTLSWMTARDLSGSWYPRKVRKHLKEFHRLRVPTSGLSVSISGTHIKTKHNPWPDRKYAEKVIEMLEESAPDSYDRIFECCSPFIHNRMPIINYRKGTVGFIDKKGQWVVKQEFIDAFPYFPDATTLVKTKNGTWIKIDTMGRTVEIYDEVKTKGGINDDILFKKNGKWGIMNHKGEVMLGNEYDTIDVFPRFGHEPLLYKIQADGKHGLWVDGKDIIPCKSNNLKIMFQSFSGGLVEQCECSDRSIRHIHVLTDYDEKELERVVEQHQMRIKTGSWMSYRMKWIPPSLLEKIGTYCKINI